MTDGTKPIMAAGDPLIPPVEEIYVNPPVRYRRFDSYCQIGCAAIALALKDAGMDRAERTRPTGIIASTRYGCFETDLAYYATAREEEGIYASPNLFAFTLPGIAISEAAIHFRLTGPTFTVGDPIGPRGTNALCIAVNLLSSGTCRTVLTGWVDTGNRLLKQKAADDDGVRGAIFIALSTGHEEKTIQQLRQKDSELYAESGMKICTIMDLVN
jgi:3-oxoacyl-[acyl-carrier-protein] synthase II